MTNRLARALARAALALALVACAGDARATLPEAGAALVTRLPQAGLVAPSGAPLPLAARFIDDTGRARPLAEVLSGNAPVLLALGYDRCPQLCGMVLQGALEAGHATGLPAAGYRLLFVSIDPRDGPADAAARLRAERGYAATIAGNAPTPRIDALVGAPADVAALASAVGYRYEPTPDAGDARYAHPAALFVLTPDGRLARRLGGVRYDAAELRAAIGDAAEGRLGPSPTSMSTGLGDRIALLCAHLDANTGHDGAVLAALRGVGLATLAALGALAWRTRRRGAS
jgi:protein SCO1/2